MPVAGFGSAQNHADGVVLILVADHQHEHLLGDFVILNVADHDALLFAPAHHIELGHGGEARGQQLWFFRGG